MTILVRVGYDEKVIFDFPGFNGNFIFRDFRVLRHSLFNDLFDFHIKHIGYNYSNGSGRSNGIYGEAINPHQVAA